MTHFLGDVAAATKLSHEVIGEGRGIRGIDD